MAPDDQALCAQIETVNRFLLFEVLDNERLPQQLRAEISGKINAEVGKALKWIADNQRGIHAQAMTA